MIFKVISLVLGVMVLQGCVTKVVTVPTKAVYKTTKGVAKGTTKAVGAVIPKKHEDEEQ